MDKPDPVPEGQIEVEVDMTKMKELYFQDLILACEFGYIAHEKGESLLQAQTRLMHTLTKTPPTK